MLLLFFAMQNIIKADTFELDSELLKPTFAMKGKGRELTIETHQKLASFYEKSLHFLNDLSFGQPLGDTEEDQIANMWEFYYMAAAPIYKTEFFYEKKKLTAPGNDEDLEVKECAIRSLARLNTTKILPSFKIEESKFNTLVATYYSKFMRDLKKGYDPELEEKISKLEKSPAPPQEKKEKKYRKVNLRGYEVEIEIEDHSDFYNWHNNLTRARNRNSTVSNLIKLAEDDFMKKLVDLFPEKAGEVKKYVRLAGYADSEIPDLIDRTVGRDSKTEFLYKGRKEEKPPRDKRDKGKKKK